LCLRSCARYINNSGESAVYNGGEVILTPVEISMIGYWKSVSWRDVPMRLFVTQKTKYLLYILLLLSVPFFFLYLFPYIGSDPRTPKPIHHDIIWRRDNTIAVIGDLGIWEFTDTLQVSNHSPLGNDLPLGSDGVSVAKLQENGDLAFLSTGNEDYLLNVEDQGIISTVPGATTVEWSPDGGRLASSFGPHIRLWSISQLCDNMNPQPTMVLERQADQMISSIVWSPSGNMLATADYESTIEIWDVESGDLLHTLIHPIGETTGSFTFTWNSDGNRLASANSDGSIRIWDTSTGQTLSEFDSGFESGGAFIIKWNPHDDRLAMVSPRGVIRVADAQTGQYLIDIPVDNQAFINEIVWSPDGHRLAGIGDWVRSDTLTVWVWDANTGEILSSHYTEP
jgi:WD40 repeat protein